jgi:hypothetical protein
MRTALQEQRREQLSIPVDRDMREALERLAERDRRTLAGYVRDRLARVLEEQSEEAAA